MLAHGHPEDGPRRLVLPRRVAVGTVETNRLRRPVFAPDVNRTGTGGTVERQDDAGLFTHTSIMPHGPRDGRGAGIGNLRVTPERTICVTMSRMSALPPPRRFVTRSGVAAGIVLAVLCVAAAVSAGQMPSAGELAARIQARYSTITDFTADFVQTQTSPLLPRPVVERGTVKISKPGRMRWTYTTGDRNETVADGLRIYNYARADGYVDIVPMPDPGEASAALLFLAGHGDLTRDFDATLPPDQPTGEWHLVLTPRSPQADFESLTLEVDRNSLAFRGLMVVDPQGGTSGFRFENLRENVGLSPREFEFTMPRGVEVRQ